MKIKTSYRGKAAPISVQFKPKGSLGVPTKSRPDDEKISTDKNQAKIPIESPESNKIEIILPDGELDQAPDEPTDSDTSAESEDLIDSENLEDSEASDGSENSETSEDADSAESEASDTTEAKVSEASDKDDSGEATEADKTKESGETEDKAEDKAESKTEAEDSKGLESDSEDDTKKSSEAKTKDKVEKESEQNKTKSISKSESDKLKFSESDKSSKSEDSKTSQAPQKTKKTKKPKRSKKSKQPKQPLTLRKKIILYSMCVVFTALLAFSGLKIYQWVQDDIHNREQQAETTEDANGEEVYAEGELVNPPKEQDDDYWYYAKLPFYQVDFNDLLAKNADTVAFIHMNDSYVNYPVVQTTDNEYYLTHAFDHSYNDAGWVFMDYRSVLPDDNTIIYGHGRYNGTVFGTLRNALTPEWQQNKDNYVIWLSTPRENFLYQIFSIYTIPSESYYLKTQFASPQGKLDWLNTMKQRNTASTNASVDVNDNILTLSTCLDDFNNRIVLHAKLIKRSAR